MRKSAVPIVVLASLMVGVGVLTSSPSAGGAGSTQLVGATCPSAPGPPIYATIDEAIEAARRLLIRGSITAQGQTIKLTRKNSPILAVVRLGKTASPFPGAATLLSNAVGRCGMQIARASWAVKISYGPAAMISESDRDAFIVKTRKGWRMY